MEPTNSHHQKSLERTPRDVFMQQKLLTWQNRNGTTALRVPVHFVVSNLLFCFYFLFSLRIQKWKKVHVRLPWHFCRVKTKSPFFTSLAAIPCLLFFLFCRLLNIRRGTNTYFPCSHTWNHILNNEIMLANKQK